MFRIVSLSVLAALGATALAAPAEADHRWRQRHTMFPLIEVFPGGWSDESDSAYLYDDEGDNVDVPKRLKRNLHAKDKWWLYEDSQSLEPAVKKPAKKPAKKSTAAAKPVKPAPKPVAKLPVDTASASAKDIEPEVKVTAPKVIDSKVTSPNATATIVETPKAVEIKKPVTVESKAAAIEPPAKAAAKPSAPLATAAVKKPPVTNGIGCTAGAAVVTGYGFGDVKPKTCTGATYSYTATRAGKSFVIELTAASGEVVDVKKL